jgi:chromosome segregation ATPase
MTCLANLQRRITKVVAKTESNTEDIELLGDSVAELNDDQTALLKRIEEQRVQAFQRSEALGLQIAKVKEENDDREVKQTLRDQNNVQSLVNLRDSTHTAFQQVKTDVLNLIKNDQGLSRRLSEVESRLSNPAPAPMPSDHVWVNKKLTGVYDSLEEVENRLSNLESGSSNHALDNKILKAYNELSDRIQKLENPCDVKQPAPTVEDEGTNWVCEEHTVRVYRKI